MVCIRHGWLVVVLGLVLGLVTACKKDEKPVTPASAKSDKATPGDDLSLLPVDSELVLGINVAQVRQSPLWKQLVEPKLMSGKAQAQLADFKANCGFDPMTELTSVSVGLKAIASDQPEGVVVTHGLDKAKVLACLESEKVKAEMAKNGSEFSRDGDVGLFKNKTGKQIAVIFVNDRTAVAVVGSQVTAASAKAAAAGNSALKSSAPFLEMYRKVNTGDSLWFLLNDKAEVFERIGVLMGSTPKAIFGSVNATDGLSLDLRMRLESPEKATEIANQGKSLLQQASTMVDKADITNEGPDVKVSVVLSSQKLQELVKQFAGMASAFGGMGGL